MSGTIHIVKKENKNVRVFSLSTTDLNLSKKILDKKIRSKISIANDINNADYIITNNDTIDNLKERFNNLYKTLNDE